jgi:hypothetical protein
MEKKANFKKVQHDVKKMNFIKWLKGSVRSDEHLELIQVVKAHFKFTGREEKTPIHSPHCLSFYC